MQSLFIHGLGQTPASWDKTISLMASQSHIKCPDIVALIENEEISYQSLYRAFSNYCDSIQGPFNLCGLSLGGVFVLNYAIDYPAKVHSLVLIGAQYKMPKTLLKIQNGIFRCMPKAAFKNMGLQKKDLIHLTKSMSSLDFSEKLERISCTTLVLCGERDNANKKAAKALAKNIPGAMFQVVTNAGHEVNVEMPKMLASELDSFYFKISKERLSAK